MIRILHVADLHLGVRRYGTGTSRIEDYGRTLRRAVQIANERADLLVIAGDTFDSRRPGPEELAEFTGALREREGSPTIVIPGNHDGMTVIGDPNSHALRWAEAARIPGAHVLLTPGWHYFDSIKVGPFSAYVLPYPHRRAFDSALADTPVDQRASAVAARVEDMLRLVTPADHTAIFIGHVSTVGAHLSESRAMALGWDVAIDPAVLAPFDAALLGHVHRQQQVAPNAWYAGSPDYADLGEAIRAGDARTTGEAAFLGMDEPKGFLLWEVEKGKPPVVERIPNDAARRMVAHRYTATGGSLKPSPGPQMRRGDIAVLEVDVSAERPTPEITAAMTRAYRDRGVSFVRVREVGTPAQSRIRESAPGEPARAWTAEASVIDNLARWLAETGRPEEPALTAGRELVAGLDA